MLTPLASPCFSLEKGRKETSYLARLLSRIRHFMETTVCPRGDPA